MRLFIPFLALASCLVARPISAHSLGPNPGRDVQTMFDDSSPNTIDSIRPPFLAGVQPRDALSSYNGEMTSGTWNLQICTGAEESRLYLTQWGLQINGINTVSTPGGPAAKPISLSMVGRNPIRDVGTIQFELPRAADVKMTLHDVLGRKLWTLASGSKGAGIHQIRFDSATLRPGVYFVRLTVDGQGSAQLKAVIAR